MSRFKPRAVFQALLSISLYLDLCYCSENCSEHHVVTTTVTAQATFHQNQPSALVTCRWTDCGKIDKLNSISFFTYFEHDFEENTTIWHREKGLNYVELYEKKRKIDLVIPKLSCPENNTLFTCMLRYDSGSSRLRALSMARLVYQIPLEPPTLLAEGALTGGGLVDQCQCAFTCTANIGTDGRAQLWWTLQADSRDWDISPRDVRVIYNEISQAENGTACSSKIAKSVLVVRVNRRAHKLSLGCHVDYPDAQDNASTNSIFENFNGSNVRIGKSVCTGDLCTVVGPLPIVCWDDEDQKYYFCYHLNWGNFPWIKRILTGLISVIALAWTILLCIFTINSAAFFPWNHEFLPKDYTQNDDELTGMETERDWEEFPPGEASVDPVPAQKYEPYEKVLQNKASWSYVSRHISRNAGGWSFISPERHSSRNTGSQYTISTNTTHLSIESQV